MTETKELKHEKSEDLRAYQDGIDQIYLAWKQSVCLVVVYSNVGSRRREMGVQVVT